MRIALLLDGFLASEEELAYPLSEIEKAPAIERLLMRCRSIPDLCHISLGIAHKSFEKDYASATSKSKLKLLVADGDALTRFNAALQDSKAEVVMKIPFDGILADPDICIKTLGHWRLSRADYGCNNMPALFPDGLDCEVFSTRWLERMQKRVKNEEEQMDVTSWLRDNRDIVKACLRGPGHGLESFRWRLQTENDLLFMRSIYRNLRRKALLASAAEYTALCLRRPDIRALNMDEGALREDMHQEADFLSDVVNLAA